MGLIDLEFFFVELKLALPPHNDGEIKSIGLHSRTAVAFVPSVMSLMIKSRMLGVEVNYFENLIKRKSGVYFITLNLGINYFYR